MKKIFIFFLFILVCLNLIYGFEISGQFEITPPQIPLGYVGIDTGGGFQEPPIVLENKSNITGGDGIPGPEDKINDSGLEVESPLEPKKINNKIIIIIIVVILVLFLSRRENPKPKRKKSKSHRR